MPYTRGQNSKQMVASNNLGEKRLLSGNDSVIYTAGAMTLKRSAHEVRNPFACEADQLFTAEVKCPTGGPHFGQPLGGAKLQSNPRGMPPPPGEGVGCFGIEWYVAIKY